jgi:predicted RNA-binding Zn-ribbon protein involved in translation (DUF1610 family)
MTPDPRGEHEPPRDDTQQCSYCGATQWPSQDGADRWQCDNCGSWIGRE